jgi:hypothetical protein
VKVALVVPCHRRYELTEVCLEQKVWLRREAAAFGVALEVIVVTEDEEHARMAEALELFVVYSDNSSLGKRWNDGYQFAARIADVAMPCGSDSWLHPDLMRWLPWRREVVVVTELYSVVAADGRHRVDLDLHRYLYGVGFMFRPELVDPLGHRPCDDRLARGCDRSTLNSLQSVGAELHRVRHHRLEYVAFQSGHTQITNLANLSGRFAGELDRDPFGPLAGAYPEDLVERVRDYYVSGRSLSA